MTQGLHAAPYLVNLKVLLTLTVYVLKMLLTLSLVVVVKKESVMKARCATRLNLKES